MAGGGKKQLLSSLTSVLDEGEWQFRSRAALSQMKNVPIFIGEGDSLRYGVVALKRNILLFPEIEPRLFCRPVRSLITMLSFCRFHSPL
jgi:hypothetical protein